MTNFSDETGITDVKGLKIRGATVFQGTSANTAAITADAQNARMFSLTAYSVNAAVFDSTESSAAVLAAQVTRIIAACTAAGIFIETHDGT